MRTTGWWYFSPVVLSVKTPTGFLPLLGMGTWLCSRNRGKLASWLPLAFSMGILIPAVSSKVNIGVRHILPIYAGFSIVAAIAVVDLVRRAQTRQRAGLAAAVLVVWIVVSGAAQHPNYLAYFNKVKWLKSPEGILVDSDLDWGQDTIRLACRLGTGRDPSELQHAESDGRPADGLAGIPAGPGHQPREAGGRMDRGEPHDVARKSVRIAASVERVGSYFLYYVPPGSIPPDRR